MNLLVTGAWEQAKEYIKSLENLGHTVQFLQYEKDSLPCQYDWVEGVICNGLFLTHPIEKFTNLKYIQLTSAGFDRVSMDYIKENQIAIYNARGVYSIPMAEYAISGVLQIYKSMNYFYEKQKKHEWNKKRDVLELFGKRVCIVGCGSVGTECAKRFQAFGCNVIGVDLYSYENVYYSEIVGIKQMKEVLPNIDILVLTLPLSKETKHLINEEKIEMLKAGAILVNIARGAIIDTNALIKNKDKFGGLVLDVFEEEPLDEKNPLWDMPNVIISPHNSFVGDGNQKRLTDVIMHNLENRV